MCLNLQVTQYEALIPFIGQEETFSSREIKSSHQELLEKSDSPLAIAQPTEDMIYALRHMEHSCHNASTNLTIMELLVHPSPRLSSPGAALATSPLVDPQQATGEEIGRKLQRRAH